MLSSLWGELTYYWPHWR